MPRQRPFTPTPQKWGKTSIKDTDVKGKPYEEQICSTSNTISLAVKEDRTMAKYMVLWEVDTSRTPEDPKAKKTQFLGFGKVVVK
jgi:hypothetical protein